MRRIWKWLVKCILTSERRCCEAKIDSGFFDRGLSKRIDLLTALLEDGGGHD